MSMFTQEELEELRKADEEIDETFEITLDEYDASRKLDKASTTGTRYSKRYYEKHKKKIMAYNREYQNRIMPNGKTWRQNYKEAHREEINARQRARYKGNPEYSKQYYYKNRERILAYRKEYYRRKTQKGNEE